MSTSAAIERLRAAGLSVFLAGTSGVTVRPASLLTADLRTLIRACHGELLEHLRHASVAAWTRRRHITDLEGVGPATLARFARASADLDRQIADADADGAQDPDRWCWPNDPSPGAAMNSAELELFGRRHACMRALGFTDDEADKLADRLKARDREGDDCVCCAECEHARAQICQSGSPPPLAQLHRCVHLIVPLAE